MVGSATLACRVRIRMRLALASVRRSYTVSSWSDGELFMLIAAFVFSQYACHHCRVIPQAFPAERKAYTAQRGKPQLRILSTRSIAVLYSPLTRCSGAAVDWSALQCE